MIDKVWTIEVKYMPMREGDEHPWRAGMCERFGIGRSPSHAVYELLEYMICVGEIDPMEQKK